MRTLLFVFCLMFLARTARADGALDPSTRARAPADRLDGTDLFPGAGRVTASAATGLPFLGIAEIGVGVSDDFAVGVVGGITPTVAGAGLRPRGRFVTGERTALVLNAPMLYYPRASAPGPGGIGSSSWLLARPELFVDTAIGQRWHLAGGMGVVAAASTEALGELFAGRDFQLPPYNGSSERRKGFAGGLWNTIAARSSFALASDAHLFAEASLVLSGVAPADNVGGPPIVVNVGAQRSF